MGGGGGISSREVERSREGGGRSKSPNTSWSDVLDEGRGNTPCSELFDAEDGGKSSWSEVLVEIRGNTSWSEILDDVRGRSLWSELQDEVRGVADLGGTGGGGGELLLRACSVYGDVLLSCS